MRLTLYYKTGWKNPVLHYGFEGGNWGDAQFSWVTGEPGWWKVALDAPCAKLECAPRAQDSSGWDNPPGGGNYKLDIPQVRTHAVAVIRHGEIAFVELGRLPWALVADMDGTLIGDPEDTVERLRRFWDLHCKFAINEEGVRLCQIVYNSGRNRIDMLKGCRENDLPKPDYMICGVGTEIYVPSACSEEDVSWYDNPVLPQPDSDWKQVMDKEFGDRDKFIDVVSEKFPDRSSLEIHGNYENDPYRLPCIAHVTEDDPDILKKLEAWGDEQKHLRVIISGFGDHRYVDFCSKHAGKGLAIEHLFKKGAFLGISDKSRILVAGDSGNDLNMFMVPGVRSVMVGNSQPSLVDAVLAQDTALDPEKACDRPYKVQRAPDGLLEVYYARGIVGDGVCEAIEHYYFS
jgi:hydroxymethylpyrimidine pyrophosphatase-like HAD family hydrolase